MALSVEESLSNRRRFDGESDDTTEVASVNTHQHIKNHITNKCSLDLP